MINAMLLCAVLVAVAPENVDDAAAADLARMQGDWMVATFKANGLREPDEVAQSMFRTVEGNRYTIFRFTKQIVSGTFKIDATATPHTIDSSPAASVDGQPLLGIYEFDGEKLRICNAPPGKPRPKDFGAKLGSLHTLIEWEREKP